MLNSFTLLQAMNGIAARDVAAVGRMYISGDEKKRGGKRIFALALAAALLLGLGTAAYAVSRRIALKDGAFIFDGENYPAVSFEKTDSEPLRLGVWELGEIPAGFSAVKSYYRGSEARTDYQNGKGETIMLLYQKPTGQVDSFINAAIVSKTEVEINGGEGVVYVAEDGWTHIFWTAAERGIAMRLSVKGDYDAVKLAQSVHEIDTVPQPDKETLLALRELGSWQTDVPAGYEELISYGVAGDYGYIYRIYENAAAQELEVYYERSVSDLEGYVAYYRSGSSPYGAISLSAVTVNGWDGWLATSGDGEAHFIVWQNSEYNMTFRITADALTSEELLRAAQGTRLCE